MFELNCALSGFGIEPGEEVYLILCADQGYREHGVPCWDYLTFPVLATYAGYGSFNVIEKDLFDHILTKLTPDLSPVSKEGVLEDIWNASLTYLDRDHVRPHVVKQELPMATIAIRKDVWEATVSLAEKELSPRNERSRKKHLKLLKGWQKKAYPLESFLKAGMDVMGNFGYLGLMDLRIPIPMEDEAFLNRVIDYHMIELSLHKMRRSLYVFKPGLGPAYSDGTRSFHLQWMQDVIKLEQQRH